MTIDKEAEGSEELSLHLLRQLNRDPVASQRHLAQQFGVSVGKVNYCLRALVEKGWVKVNNFRRHDNKWGYMYLLTPTGMKAKIALARAFLARKEAEYEALQAEIEILKNELPSPHNK